MITHGKIIGIVIFTLSGNKMHIPWGCRNMSGNICACFLSVIRVNVSLANEGISSVETRGIYDCLSRECDFSQ